ncbi:MAG: hypothetical protein ACFFDT_26785 [Candidatus Hodarchaeota archaeon]
MANNQTIGLIDKVRYYIWENKHTQPFFNPKILILPGGLAAFLSFMSGGDLVSFISSLMVFFYLLVLEWLVIYLVIMYRRANSIIDNQNKIIQLLEENKMNLDY